MSKLIQVRNVPDAVHRALKVRAAEQGRSLSDYLLEELEQVALRPTRAEAVQRLAAREPAGLRRGEAARAVRSARQSAGR